VTGASDQLRVRYDAAAKHYEVQLPLAGTWLQLVPEPDQGADLYSISSGAFVAIREGEKTGYDYSAVASWGTSASPWPADFGSLAFGIPTPSAGVPTTGSASYGGALVGYSTETVPDTLAGADVASWIEGSINLAFDFGNGTLSGNINPIVYSTERFNLAPLQFTDTVYSSGSPTFSGKFGTALPGPNAFSGRFTGPAAQELIGSFAFPYQSPTDGKTYDAGGAFIGKKQ
jgi:hypothetical protein